MKRITIIGGGASGTLLAVNLIKNASDDPIKVDLVESRPRGGKRVLWESTASPEIRLQAHDLSLKLLAA